VHGAIVAQGDLVLFDHDNHKPNHHGALALAGGIPVYLETDCSTHGLIGPIDYAAFDEAALGEKIKSNPLITDTEAWKRKKPFRIAVVEQCSYYTTIYDASMVFKKLSPLCDYILFDEAWAGFMKFPPLIQGGFTMGLEQLGPDDDGIIATRHTHQQLAIFSQASQIHVKDSHAKAQKRHVLHMRFNNSFMLHASTLPFYPSFASLNVGRYDDRAQPTLDYLIMFEKAAYIFQEFDSEIKGVHRETGEDGRIGFYSYVVCDIA
jgi:arginine/lysine/ornithine decarboxylase